jgi:protein-S-isoprenylcysteine O-methyltransferase Ste14
LGLGSMSELAFARMPIAPIVAVALGVAMMAIGIVIKAWATLVLGVDGYYYRDMLLGRRGTDGFARRGPYRWLQNPMYGAGQLHAYGYAVLHRSWSGLAAAAICQTLIYLFYVVVERPFVERVYVDV